MRVAAVLLLGACLSLSACGGNEDDGGSPSQGEKETADSRAVEELAKPLNEDRTGGPDAKRPLRRKGPACPPGTDLVRVRDLVGRLPPGYDLARVAEEPLVVDLLRVVLRGRLRLVETRVLLKRGRRIGTSVTVLNAPERMSAQDFLAGALEGARDAGTARSRPIEIAGGEGVLVSTSDGAIASALGGTCAAVVLTDGNEARLLRAVSLLSRP